MSSIISREVERYISKRSIPGKIGIVRVTGPVANDALYQHPGDPQALLYQSRDRRARLLAGLLRRSGQGVVAVVTRLYKSIQRDRAKRRSYQMLATLNQSTLWDIGIGPRANIANVVEAAHSPSEQESGAPQVVRSVDESRRQEAANELTRQAVA
jgi:hypothetical protein